MFKKLSFMALLSLLIMSCSNESETSLTEETFEQSAKQVNLSVTENFRKAINEMNQPKYHPTKEYTEKYGSELSPERKQILLEPAKELIYSTGIDERALQNEANGDINIILNKAFKIYISQTSKK